MIFTAGQSEPTKDIASDIIPPGKQIDFIDSKSPSTAHTANSAPLTTSGNALEFNPSAADTANPSQNVATVKPSTDILSTGGSSLSNNEPQYPDLDPSRSRVTSNASDVLREKADEGSAIQTPTGKENHLEKF